MPERPGPHTVLGFDFGEWRVGVAVGQSVTGQATPLTVLHNRDRGRVDFDAIGALIEEWRPAALVLGIPRRDDGSDYPVTRLAEKFGRRLEGRFRLPVHRVDERFSSMEARRRLSDRRVVDHGAAAIITENWLSGGAPEPERSEHSREGTDP